MHNLLRQVTARKSYACLAEEVKGCMRCLNPFGSCVFGVLRSSVAAEARQIRGELAFGTRILSSVADARSEGTSRLRTIGLAVPESF